MSERVYTLFQRNVEATMQVGEAMADPIQAAANILVNTLLNEGKILICGNGPSSALAQLFASQLIDRFEKERPSLPAIWLGANMSSYTGIIAENQYNEVYAKPIRALARAGDTLVVISSSGNAQNLIQAISSAHERELNVIALTGRDGGGISQQLNETDLEIQAGINVRSRIHELHLLSIHCLCDLIDHSLFGIE